MLVQGPKFHNSVMLERKQRKQHRWPPIPRDGFSKKKTNDNKAIRTAALPQEQTLTKDAYPFHNIHIGLVQTAIISTSDSDLIIPLRGIGNADFKVPDSSDRELCQIGTF
jgi:hypothetical protein